MPLYIGPRLRWTFRDVTISFVLGVITGAVFVALAVM